MSEFRQNIVTQEWVIIAPERGKKPKVLKEDETEQNLLSEYNRDCKC